MGKPGRDRAPSPVNPGDSATRQEVCHEGPFTRSRWRGYHLARPGGTPEPNGVQYPRNQTSKLKPQSAHSRIEVRLQDSLPFVQITVVPAFMLEPLCS